MRYAAVGNGEMNIFNNWKHYSLGDYKPVSYGYGNMRALKGAATSTLEDDLEASYTGGVLCFSQDIGGEIDSKAFASYRK